MHSGVTKPILFNAWKHHLGFICDEIFLYEKGQDSKKIKESLLIIGNSTSDIYTGDFNPIEIGKHILKQLSDKNLPGRENFIDWIMSNNSHYRTIDLPDTSRWVLRIGNEHERFVHIHPGRKSPLSIRIKASILKTGIASALLAITENSNIFDLQLINMARRKFCQLEPIKTVSMNHELGRFLELIRLKLNIS